LPITGRTPCSRVSSHAAARCLADIDQTFQLANIEIDHRTRRSTGLSVLRMLRTRACTCRRFVEFTHSSPPTDFEHPYFLCRKFASVTVREVVFVFRNLMTFLSDSLLNAFALAKFLLGLYEVFVR